jgi:hypothetical protein
MSEISDKKPPCCKMAINAIKWIFRFVFRLESIFIFIIAPAILIWAICILWGYYIADVWVFNPAHYYALPEKDKLANIVMASFCVMAVGYALYMQYVVRERKNCSVLNVSLRELSQIWRDDENNQPIDNEQTQKTAMLEKALAETNNKNRLLELGKIAVTPTARKFVEESLTPFIHKFSNQEVEIVKFLLEVLEKHGSRLPSVASKFKDDFDVRQFRNGGNGAPKAKKNSHNHRR